MTQIKPDLVLYFGSRPVSAILPEYLKNSKADILLISSFNSRQEGVENELIGVSKKYCCNSEALIKKLLDCDIKTFSPDLLGFFNDQEAQAKECLDRILVEEKELTEAYALTQSFKRFLSGSLVYMSPSLLCRIAEYFVCYNKQIKISANRGLAGIDGVVASAAGFFAGFNNTEGANNIGFVLCGDQALWHDLTSLRLIKDLNLPAHIICFNDNGGAVFDLLNLPELKEELLNAHDSNFQTVAQSFGFDYRMVKNKLEFNDRLNNVMVSERKTFTEVSLEPSQAAEFLKEQLKK